MEYLGTGSYYNVAGLKLSYPVFSFANHGSKPKSLFSARIMQQRTLVLSERPTFTHFSN